MTTHSFTGASGWYSRRELLSRSFNGIGALALASLLADEPRSASAAGDSGSLLAARKPHFAPAAKRCIFLFMSGGVSQVDTFEYKPALTKFADKTVPPLPNLKGEIAANLTKNVVAMPEVYPFVPRGDSGRHVSSLFENLGPLVDRLAFVHGIIGDSNNHGPATLQIHTGSELQGNPSVGSWISYGLGSESRDLPGYVVICDPRGEPTNGNGCWSAGYLPATFQGTPLNSKGPPIVDLNFPAGMTAARARRELDLIRRLNERHAAERPELRDLEARIAAYELAYRMQIAAPEAIDISSETEATQRLYGLDQPHTRGFGRQCLLARRLAERGVRFTLLVHGVTNSGEIGWDHHGAIRPNIKNVIGEVDRPIAGLLTDLAQRGMLDDTLVVFTSEMGRTPFRQLGTPADADKAGRDHNQYGLCSWLAGAGVKPASDAGQTDEFGVRGIGEEILMRDFHATILHLLGIEDSALTYLHDGRFKRLTDLGGRVLDEILA
ncbi:MAG: DUF1501 domain-containing protein [Planctomycetia bacterium]|nr:DUF1501 domain-containing protein [Planctomycetia bacterium]